MYYNAAFTLGKTCHSLVTELLIEFLGHVPSSNGINGFTQITVKSIHKTAWFHFQTKKNNDHFIPNQIAPRLAKSTADYSIKQQSAFISYTRFYINNESKFLQRRFARGSHAWPNTKDQTIEMFDIRLKTVASKPFIMPQDNSMIKWLKQKHSGVHPPLTAFQSSDPGQ